MDRYLDAPSGKTETETETRAAGSGQRAYVNHNHNHVALLGTYITTYDTLCMHLSA